MAESNNTDDYEITTKEEEDTENIEEDEQKETSFGATPSSTTTPPATGSAAAAARANDTPMRRRSYLPRCFNACRSLPFGNVLEIESDIFEHWLKYSGDIQYYRYKRDNHSGLCFRQVEGAANSVLKADITTTESGSWWLRVRKTEWKPGDKTVVVCERQWHIASLVQGVHDHAKSFGDWNKFKKNCNSWTKKVPVFLKNNSAKIKCNPVTSYENFCAWAANDLKLSVKTYVRLKQM